MPIPRLPADTNDLDLNITINKRLRPYLTYWYTRKKEAGETPEQFVIRALKTNALNDYLADEGKKAMEEIELDKTAATESLQTDVTSLTTEVE